MTICRDCADKNGLTPKDKIVGTWLDQCPYCKEVRVVCNEIHDYKRPGQRPVTLEDLYIVGMEKDNAR